MKKSAKDLNKGDRIEIAGEVFTIEEMEISDIGKQGTRKVRIVATTPNGEKITLIRPAEYPINVK